MGTDEPFGVRLRRERERRQIALSSISANTKISAALFEGLERGDVSRWPSGLFRRAFIRAYAEAIGLDAELTTREFLARYPDPLELERGPFPPTTAPSTPAPPPPTPARTPPPRAGDAVLRLTLADAGTKFVAGCLLTTARRRWAAAAFDASVALAIALVVFAASGHFWVPLGVSMLAYHLGAVLLLGNTPGVCVWAPEPGAGEGRGAGGAASRLRAWLRQLAAARRHSDGEAPKGGYVTTRGYTYAATTTSRVAVAPSRVKSVQRPNVDAPPAIISARRASTS